MATITVRNLPDDVHRALRVMAARHGRSAESEIRDILSRAAKPSSRIKLGDSLAALGRDLGLTDADIDSLKQVGNRTPAEPIAFE